MTDNERITAANTGFASGGVTCKLGATCFYSSSVLVDSFVLRNPPERKALPVMPKLRMKTLLTYILLFLTTNLLAQTDLGLGLVSINFDAKTTLHFYSTPNDKEPKKTIQFFNDQTINSWNIRDLDKHRQWLNPEILWLDYSQFVFRCLTISDNWLKVIVNNETEETLWIEKSDLTTFSDWESYLKEMFGVARLPDQQQKIRSSPTDNSEEISYQGRDCFQVKSMKGEWIEIFTADYCDESYTDNETKIKSGWIKWRQGNKLLIEYFTTS